MSYLGAELTVCCDDGNFDNSNHQNSRNSTQEPKDIIISSLILPQILKHKEQLDKENSEWNETSQQRAEWTAQIPRLGWNLTGNCIGLQRMLPWRRTHISNPTSKVNQGNLDEKPKCKKTDQGAEWNCRAGCLSPNKQVQDQYQAECQTREKQSSL